MKRPFQAPANPERLMPFTDHLEELRTRLIRAILGLLVAAAICLPFQREIFHLLMRPLLAALGNEPMIALGVADLFWTYLKVALLGGLFLASPWVFYQLWAFIAPGLHSHERKLAIPFIASTTFFFVSGAAFGYFLLMPVAFEYLLSFSDEYVKATLDVQRNFGFALQLLIVFGLVFELPVILTLLAKLGIVDAPKLRRFRRYWVVVAFAIGAIATPTPDAVTQTFASLPLIVLYEVGIVSAKLFGRKPLDPDAGSGGTPGAAAPPGPPTARSA